MELNLARTTIEDEFRVITYETVRAESSLHQRNPRSVLGGLEQTQFLGRKLAWEDGLYYEQDRDFDTNDARDTLCAVAYAAIMDSRKRGSYEYEC